MCLINIICTDKESFKYSVLLYIDYYNIKKNCARVSQLFLIVIFMILEIYVNRLHKPSSIIKITTILFEVNCYFYDTRGFMRIKYVKLSNNGYLVSIPVKNGQTIRINIDIKNKLLSIDFCDITYIMFFKKVQVILKKLPIYLKEIDIEINQEGNHLIFSMN